MYMSYNIGASQIAAVVATNTHNSDGGGGGSNLHIKPGTSVTLHASVIGQSPGNII